MSLAENLIHYKKRLFNQVVKLLYYTMPAGYSVPPFALNFDITFVCNLRCKMCPYYGESAEHIKLKKELPTEEIKKMLDSIKRAYRFWPYKPILLISGGEPLLRKGFFEIAEHLKSIGLKYVLISNFTTLNKETANKLIEHNPENIFISIDGPEKLHDIQRNKKGSFKKTLANIKMFKKMDTNNTPISIDCTVTKINYADLEDVLKTANRLGVAVRYMYEFMLPENIVEANKKVTKKVFGETLPPWYYSSYEQDKLNKDQVKTVIKSIRKIRKKAKKMKIPISFLPDGFTDKEIARHYLDYSYKHSDICTYPYGGMRINSYGEVYPCLAYKVGNLRKQEFSDIINGKRMRKFRSELRKNKLFPGCVRCCKL